MRGKMDCHGLTDRGQVRPSNEDQFLVADLSRSMLIHQTSLNLDDHTRLFGGSQGHLLLVADGMGGHAAGERASSLAVDNMTRYVLHTMPWFFGLREDHEDDLREQLVTALERCQERIEQEAAALAERRRMGTTLTMAYLLWPRLYVVHAGDSRCYVLRGGKLQQVTTDHTMAQRMVETGVLTAEKAVQSPLGHVLWNCVGGGTRELYAEVRKVMLALGDTLLLCTDGLTTCVKDDKIAEVLGAGQSAEETGRRLVAAANAAGAPDNVTVVVAHFREGGHTAMHGHAHAHAGRAAAAPTESERPALAPALATDMV
jgi:protein phosphatase